MKYARSRISSSVGLTDDANAVEALVLAEEPLIDFLAADFFAFAGA
jgi:hypothetical protein